MKKTTSFTLIALLFLLSSCAPSISTSISKNYAALDTTEEVSVIDLSESVPLQSELLGEVKIGDAGFTNKCDFETVITAAKLEARKVGGNAIKIVSHQYPDLASTCHRILAQIYKVNPMELAKARSDDPTATKNMVKDTIQITKVAGGHKFNYNGQTLTMNSLGELLNKNTLASKYYNKAYGTNGLLQVLGYLGGGLIGYPIGTFLGGGEPNWKLAAVGLGVLAVSIPIVSSANINLLKAVNAYNQASIITKKENNFDVRLGVNQTGLALIVNF